MEIRPIKTEEDYEAALTEIDGLMDAEPDSEEGDKLDILVTLVEKFEEQFYPIETPDPIEAIRFRLEQLGANQGRLAEILGSASRASEVLGKQRRLSLSMVRKVSGEMNIPAEVLVQDYKLRT